jgi:hypothetical protein
MSAALARAEMKLAVAIALTGILGCSGQGQGEGDETSQSELSGPGNTPMACADPTAFSAGGKDFVFCTGMAHVWTTSDWKSFQDERRSLTFDFGDMPERSRAVAEWWAPTVIHDAAQSRFVMWVSVIDGQNWPEPTRSLAVFHAPAPLGPWTYAGLGDNASASGQMLIDPMIFRDQDGAHYLYFKRYGGGLSSRIMGAKLDAALTGIVGARHAIMDGFDAHGWELNVRENPAMWRNPTSGRYHLLFSGAHWRDDTYATGHALSTCGGPLCAFEVTTTGQGGIPQVVQAKNDPAFQFGGPGGAVWHGDGQRMWIVYAAASRSASGDKTRYLQRDPIRWFGTVPYVPSAHHHPIGF